MKWQHLYERAHAAAESAAGYYNKNVRLAAPDGDDVIVRIPIPGAEVMDLRIWAEQDVLAAIAPYVTAAPRVYHVATDPDFQIHQYLSGAVLNDIAPRGVAVPPHVLDDIVRLFGQLAAVPRADLPAIPPDWPADGDCAGFGFALSALTQRVYDSFRDEYGPLYRTFGVPADPLAPIRARWPSLTERPFVCVHADVHRKNILVDAEISGFLDWELALWGDPVYDLAVHFHKMGYFPAEQQHVLESWLAEMPVTLTKCWEPDLALYLAHERVKSAIVDTVRYSQTFVAGEGFPYEPEHMVDMLVAKLNLARDAWGITARIDRDTVHAALTDWTNTHTTR